MCSWAESFFLPLLLVVNLQQPGSWKHKMSKMVSELWAVSALFAPITTALCWYCTFKHATLTCWPLVERQDFCKHLAWEHAVAANILNEGSLVKLIPSWPLWTGRMITVKKNHNVSFDIKKKKSLHGATLLSYNLRCVVISCLHWLNCCVCQEWRTRQSHLG